LVLEIRIEGEGTVEAEPAHRREADAVDQAQLAAVRRQSQGEAGVMKRRVDPFQAKQRHGIRIVGACRAHAQPPLNQGQRLEEDIAGGDQLFPRYDDTTPELSCGAVIDLKIPSPGGRGFG